MKSILSMRIDSKDFLMPQTLIGRLIFLPSIAIMVTFLIAAIIMGVYQYNTLHNNLIANSTLLTKEIGTSIEKYLLLDDYAEAESIIHRFSRLEMINSISLVNDIGVKIIEVQHKKEGESSTIYESIPSYTYLNDHNHLFIDESTQFFVVHTPLYKGEDRWWIKVRFDKKGLYSQLVSLFSFGALMVVFFMILLSFIIIKILRNPLKEIQKLTLFSSELDQQIGAKISIECSVRETDALANSLNKLSLKLSDNQKIMNEQNQELQAFNVELIKRVEEETQKNREKDVILFKQSRIVALGNMMEHIAHQWRQPLNAIAVRVQELELISELGELNKKEVSLGVEEIMEHIRYLSQTIDEFGNYVKVNSEEAPFNISHVIHQTIAVVSSSMSHKNINIYYDMDELLTLRKGSAQGFGQVVLNILNNAIDAFSDTSDLVDKKIHITLRDKGLEITLEICDNAGGIPEKMIEKIFDPYVTTKHQYRGTGLGLYISKNIVEKEMNGYLSVINYEEGACFSILIPSA